MYHTSWRPRRAIAVAAAVLVLACFAPRLASTAAADEPAPGVMSFDGAGAVLISGDGPTASELVIQNFAGGDQVVRWSANMVPVPFCTVESNRPATVTAQQFHDAVRLAAAMWNNIDAALGVRYTGTCAAAQVNVGDRVNQIGWDDARNMVSGSQAGVTQGTWLSGSGRRDFVEADIVLDNNFNVPEACLRTVIAHEIGHAIGFGHSDAAGDLMAPSFTATACLQSASASEAGWLINLYGSNRKPVLTRPADRNVLPGASVTLAAIAADPDGDAVTFEWKQIAGPAITLPSTGATTSFTAPESGPVTIEVAALDQFLHRTTATVTIAVTPAVVSAAGVRATPSASTGFQGTLAPSGVTLARWSGGAVAAALATPGIQVRSIWTLQGGLATGYIAGAPDFVNQPFLALFPGGSIPGGTLLAVVTGN